MFQAVGRLNRTRCALMSAVRELASDIEAFLDGAEPASEIAESRRDTEPCPSPGYHDRDEPSAPAVPATRPTGGP